MINPNFRNKYFLLNLPYTNNNNTSSNQQNSKSKKDEFFLDINFDESKDNQNLISIRDDLYEIFHLNGNNKIIFLLYANQISFNLELFSITEYSKNITNGNKLIKTLKGHKDKITGIKHHSNEMKSYIISTSLDKQLIIWSSNNNFEIYHILQTENNNIYSCLLIFSDNNLDKISNNDYLIISSKKPGYKTELYNFSNFTFIKNLTNSQYNVNQLLLWKHNLNTYIILIYNALISILDFNTMELYTEFNINSKTSEEKNKDNKENNHRINVFRMSLYTAREDFSCGVIYKNNEKELLICWTNLGYIKIFDLINKNLSWSLTKYGERRNTDIWYGNHMDNRYNLILWNDRYVICGIINKKESIIFIIDMEIKKIIFIQKTMIKDIKMSNFFDLGKSLVITNKDNQVELWSVK